MIRKTTFLLLLQLLLVSNILFSQNLLQHIPADATLVVGFNPMSVNSKVDVNALKQLDFCKEMMLDMARELNADETGVLNDAINNPAQYGMDFNSNSYFFMQAGEEGTYFSYLFKLSDAAVFSDFFKTKLLNAEKGLRVETKDGMTIASTATGSVSWNNKMAIMTSVEIKKKEAEEDYYDWEDDEYTGPLYGENEEEEQGDVNVKPGEKDSDDLPSENWEWEDMDTEADFGKGESEDDFEIRRTVLLDQFTHRLYHIPADSTLLTNAKFVTHLGKRNDVSFWLDYKFIQQMGMEDLSALDPSMGAFLKAYQNFFGDAYWSMRMNFDPGVIDIESEMMMSEEWTNYLQASVDSKANKKFSKYLKGDQLFGYLFFNYNMENVMREGKKLILPMLESVPMAGPMADDLLGILDIFIDEEAIYEFFKGDFCLAFTGMREFENRVTTYDYDEDFNLTEKEELKKQTLPEFVMMMSYGNEENLSKFFRLGEKMGGLEKKGAYFEIPMATSMGMNMYAAYHKGILFFTNDRDLVRSKLGTGWVAKRRIAKVHRKRMKKNAQVMFWDIPKSLNSASELGIPFGLSGDQIVNVSKQSLESILVTSPRSVKDDFQTQMSFRFANKQMNALEQFFNFLNEIYLTGKGGTSM